MKFEELGLEEFIVKALEKQGISEPTEIQYKTIPLIKSGVDVVGKSQTGSGKTYAYGLSAIEKIDLESKSTQVLIICPTRELAVQVTEELRKITEFKEGCKIVPVFGGSSIDRQIQSLKKGARIIVGTPGRIMDHLRRKTIKLHDLKMLVLDEADEMLDMGFREDIETILKTTNNTHQTVMFSATMPKQILELTKNYMNNPVYIEVNKDKKPLDIKEYYVNVGGKDKKNTLKELIAKQQPELAIVFCNTKKMVTDLQKTLAEENIQSVALHGDMRQSERTRVMKSIKSGLSNLLIATDVAARGIDINNVDIVYNYDLPNNSEYYTHRIGRTGRAGKSGIAYTIINTKQQLGAFISIMKETGNNAEESICSYTKTKDYKVIPKDNNKLDNKKNNYSTNKFSEKNRKFNSDNKSFKNDKKSYQKYDKKDENKRFSDKNYGGNKDRYNKESFDKNTDKRNNTRTFNRDEGKYTKKSFDKGFDRKKTDSKFDNKNESYRQSSNRKSYKKENDSEFTDSINKAKDYYNKKTTYHKNEKSSFNNNGEKKYKDSYPKKDRREASDSFEFAPRKKKSFNTKKDDFNKQKKLTITGKPFNKKRSSR